MDRSNLTQRISRLSTFNPFASKDSSSATQSPKGSSFSISRSFSQRGTSQQQQQQPATAASSAAEPPPAYSETLASPLGASSHNLTTSKAGAYQPLSASNVSTDNDEFAFLSSFDTVFLIDDSGSMAGRSWAEVGTVLKEIVPTCVAHDLDGIDVYFLNHKTAEKLDKASGKAGTGFRGVASASDVDVMFNSSGCCRSSTPTPSPPIVTAAKELDELRAPGYQIGIQFFQVGDDSRASEALANLDDGLAKQGIRDIVDTCYFQAGTRGTLTSQKLLKVVLGAVDKRIDRKDTKTAAETKP
ncbi:hypothetical protein PG987_000175 [Apiospora arundinis]